MGMDDIDILILNLIEDLKGEGNAGPIADQFPGIDARIAIDAEIILAIITIGIIRCRNNGFG